MRLNTWRLPTSTAGLERDTRAWGATSRSTADADISQNRGVVIANLEIVTLLIAWENLRSRCAGGNTDRDLSMGTANKQQPDSHCKYNCSQHCITQRQMLSTTVEVPLSSTAAYPTEIPTFPPPLGFVTASGKLVPQAISRTSAGAEPGTVP